MVRRSFLSAASAALAGLFAPGRAPAVAPGMTAPALPFPLVTVRGDQALAEWRRLREAEEGWPVIVGDDEQVALLADMLTMDERTPEQILAAASALNMPQALAELRGVDLSAMKADVIAARDAWPDDDVAGADGFPWVAHDHKTGAPWPRVHIAIIPTRDPTAVPAWLRFGGWNDCPPPEHHVAFLRDQRDRYGVELVAAGFDTLEFLSDRTPATRQEALDLACEVYLYCPDTVDQGLGRFPALAKSLMTSRQRLIWWD